MESREAKAMQAKLDKMEPWAFLIPLVIVVAVLRFCYTTEDNLAEESSIGKFGFRILLFSDILLCLLFLFMVFQAILKYVVALSCRAILERRNAGSACCTPSGTILLEELCGILLYVSVWCGCAVWCAVVGSLVGWFILAGSVVCLSPRAHSNNIDLRAVLISELILVLVWAAWFAFAAGALNLSVQQQQQQLRAGDGDRTCDNGKSTAADAIDSDGMSSGGTEDSSSDVESPSCGSSSTIDGEE